MMRVSTKTAAIIVALITGVVAGTGSLIVYAFREASEIERVVRDNLDDMMAAAELDIALLRQRGYVAAFILGDQDQRWLDELESLEPGFRARIEAAMVASDTPGERRRLADAVEHFRHYDAARDEVVALCRRGDLAAARRQYLGELDRSYREVAAAFESILVAGSRDIREAIAVSASRLDRLKYVVTGGVFLTLALGGWLLWVLYAGVFAPLRRMTVQAAAASGELPGQVASLAEGHVNALGRYLGTLTTQVAQARSEAERSRADARHAEKLAALGNAIAHLAHEIRNRLALIGGYANLIWKRPGDAESAGRNALTIYQEALRLEGMLTKVMEYSKPTRAHMRVQALDGMLNGLARVLDDQKPKGICLKTHLDPTAPQVAMDAERMEQVMLNLVRNAIDAMPDGGTITVATRRTPTGVAITVSDEGCGIPDDVRGRLFTPFFTTKKQGNGLGLAISRQIVADHGGAMSAESTPGGGASFLVTLPAAPRPP